MAIGTPDAPLTYIHVGLGSWGRQWAEVLLPEARRKGIAVPAAVVDTDKTRFPLAQAALGIGPERCFTSIDDALAAIDCDFITVVVPPAFHEQVIESAVRAGKHILSEKPIADTIDACIRIAELVARHGLKMAVTMSHRFDQDKQTLQDLVRGGSYGDINYLIYRFTSARREYGAWGEFRHKMVHPLLIEGAVHHFDVLRALTGSDARTVYTDTWNPAWAEYAGDSTALAIVEMENGVRCLYEGCSSSASSLNTWRHDSIRVECDAATVMLDRRRLRAVTSGAEGLLHSEELPLSTKRDAWLNHAIIEDFCGWLNGGPAPETEVADNLQCCALLFAAVESADTGKPVDVQEFLRAARERVRKDVVSV